MLGGAPTVTHTPELLVYTDPSGETHHEYCNTASLLVIRSEELEAAGYTVVAG